MLRLIANDRTPLHLPPEPIRMLVLSVSPAGSYSDAEVFSDDETVLDAPARPLSPERLEARLSTVVAEGEPEVLVVRKGDRVQIGRRHFVVTGLCETGLLGACVEMDQIPAP